MSTLSVLNASRQAQLRRKITLVIWALRGLSSVYTLWVLWRVLRPLHDSSDHLSLLGQYWQRDLTAAAPWQLWSAVGLNFALWLMLLAAVLCVWQASRHLLQDMGISPATSVWLKRGAWAGLICTVLGILVSPLMSQIYTLHLPADLRLWKWTLQPNMLMDIMTCGVLLMLSYLMAWTSEVAEENKAFV